VLLLLIVQLPGRSCGYCSYGTDVTRVAHFKRKAAAFAARVTASRVAHFKRKAAAFAARVTASNGTAVRKTRVERKWLFV
jgi:hypothetical protein